MEQIKNGIKRPRDSRDLGGFGLGGGGQIQGRCLPGCLAQKSSILYYLAILKTSNHHRFVIRQHGIRLYAALLERSSRLPMPLAALQYLLFFEILCRRELESFPLVWQGGSHF